MKLFCFIFTLVLIHIKSFGQADYVISRGTCIVAYVTENAIWIAADTKQTNTSNQDTVYSNESKIFKSQNIYYAFAGLPRLFALDGRIIFSAEDIFARVSKKNKSYEATIRDFKVQLRDTLEKYLPGIAKKRPEVYKSLMKKSVVEGVILSIAGGKVKFNNIKFNLTGIGNIRIEDEFYNRGVFFSHIGHRTLVSKQIDIDNDSKFLLKKFDEKKYLIKLINLEIKKNPNEVGPPIDIVKITKNGHTWLTPNKVNF